MIGILIAHLPQRKNLLQRVLDQLDEQRAGKDVKIYIDSTTRLTTGQKRNRLLETARASKMDYVEFVDDDDLIGPNYINLSVQCAESGSDCMELYGQYYEHGKQMPVFHHSIKYDHWYQDAKMYYRNPNHLNLIKLSLLNNIRFKDLTIGEDGHYSIDIQKEGILKTEFKINEIIYHYFAGKRKHADEPGMMAKRGAAI